MLGCTQGTFNFAIIQKIWQFILFPVCALELGSSGSSGSRVSLGLHLFERQPFEEGVCGFVCGGVCVCVCDEKHRLSLFIRSHFSDRRLR